MTDKVDDRGPDMLSPKVQELFNEPGCDKNAAKDEKARKKGCSKPLTPGAAAGGCAFDGAKIVLQPITDAAHLIHAPLACEGQLLGQPRWRRPPARCCGAPPSPPTSPNSTS